MSSLLDKIVELAQQESVDITQWDDFEEISTFMVDKDLPIPKIINMIEENQEMSFDIVDCDVSFVNALRRTMLSDIPVCCIRTENESVNQCHILVNHTRLHNEILKQRLSSIPIHTTDLELLPGKYQLVVDVTNDTDHVLLVTTEHFKLRQIGTDIFMTDELTKRIFPPSYFPSVDFIHFATLKPATPFIQHTSHPKLHLVAEFSVANAKTNSMFNVVAKCSYFANVDWDKAHTQLHTLQTSWKFSQLSDAEIKLRTDNFMLLDAFKFNIHNSWHFSFQSIGQLSLSHILSNSFKLIQQTLLHIAKRHSNTVDDFTYANLITHALHFIRPLQFHSLLQTHPHILDIHILSNDSAHITTFAAFTALYLTKGTYGSL